MTMTAHVVEAIPTPAHSEHRRFFVKSATDCSIWYRVDLDPTATTLLSCSCPAGRRISRVFSTEGAVAGPRACRHLRAVAERIQDECKAAVS